MIYILGKPNGNVDKVAIADVDHSPEFVVGIGKLRAGHNWNVYLL